ncbi:uncharacterized protein LOC119599957 [Lucilia sericata]|uniref:uncharacterized protein LOC119599957 n=1 Tax=Lucilia sericata TaxID=13632 RepID=UPI0018A7EB52|nr:uncharacterized protein LOC119599957 [Lucilia sericata]
MNLNLTRNRDSQRLTLLDVSDTSNLNEYTMTSSLSETHPISMEHNRRLVNEMIDYIFDERKGICEVSSSPCSSLQLPSSEYSYDKRLKYWKDVLKEREKLSLKINEQTKKNPSDILYNRLVTVDERDKHTVKRLMDYAQRLNPTILSTRQPSVLKEKCDLAELQETLPKTERQYNAAVEISGLPKVAQEELLGKPKYQGCKKPSSWLKSKHLENCIEEIRSDIEHVIEYYPDIDNLQIVGESILNSEVKEHNSEIQIMSSKEICKISTDTFIEGDLEECQIQTNIKTDFELLDYAFKINDQIIFVAKKRSTRSFKAFTNFSCFPFETEIKKIFSIQNIGRKVLTFEWSHRSFYEKNSALLKAWDNEFAFDTKPFRLCSGEVRDILVKFQPRRVNIVKGKWVLNVKPTFFSRKLDGIVMRLSGICTAPPEYERKLNEMQREVIQKSNRKMVNELTNGLGNLAADLQPSECTCPYQRSLNEMELFEQLNSGFKCERYHDLELLKNLFKRAKKPRENMWDLQVKTLKSAILKVNPAETRALMFNELTGILESMKGRSIDLESKIVNSPERQRTRLLFIRGIISTAIEEWVDLVGTIEDSFYQTSLQVLNEELTKQQSENEEIKEQNENILKILQYEDTEKRQYILEKRVHKLVPYRDALYMQTYTLMCDFVENIVNIIESTEVI